jgi:hypothetical protein
VEHIRGLPDFGEFLLPKKSASLCGVAVSGPAVVVNTHKDRCGALILLPNSSQVSHVPLSELQVSGMSSMQLRLAGLIRGTHVEELPCGLYEGASLPKWDEEIGYP